MKLKLISLLFFLSLFLFANPIKAFADFNINFNSGSNTYSFTNNFSTTPYHIIATSTDGIHINQNAEMTNGLDCSGTTCTFTSPYTFNTLSNYVFIIDVYDSQSNSLYHGSVTFFSDQPTPTYTPTATPTPTSTPAPTPSIVNINYVPTSNSYSFTNNFSTTPYHILATSTNGAYINQWAEITNGLNCTSTVCSFTSPYSFNYLSNYVYTIAVYTINDLVLYNGPVDFLNGQPTPTQTPAPTPTATPHNQPSTSASLTPVAQNEYPDPVTITLQATADNGYSVANTYYTIDEGTQQTYSTPFTVTAPGNHTITYWSVDSHGLEENPHKSQNFTISNNAIASTLNSGLDQTTTIGNATLTFSDVTSAGHVVQTTSTNNQGGPLPSLYRLLGSYYNLTTTSTYTGTITLTFSYNPAEVNNPNRLKLFHYNGTNWENITTSIDTVNHTITGVTTSLSPFAIGEQDVTPPTITNFQLSPYVISSGNSSTIIVDSQDDLTGVQSVTYSLSASNGQITTDNLSFISPSGKWQAILTPTTGVYAVKVTTTDFAGNQKVSDYLYLAVYNPSAGHVTGGGWVTPNSSTLIGISSNGKANYGFNVKYINGSSSPHGNFSMNYNENGLEFKSTSFEWLTVTSETADFQGQATLNGSGNYTFRVHVADGSPDQFDIRIWTFGNSFDNPNYRISNNVGGGNIVVHQ